MTREGLRFLPLLFWVRARRASEAVERCTGKDVVDDDQAEP